MYDRRKLQKEKKIQLIPSVMKNVSMKQEQDAIKKEEQPDYMSS